MTKLMTRRSDVTVAVRSKITGVGGFVPPRVVTNDDLAQLMDTSNEWIVERTGIRQRHWVDPETTTSDLALEAANAALAAAGAANEDVDMLIVATLSSDHFFPGTACFLQTKMGISEIPALDIRQQCTGFVYAASIADQFIRTGMYRTVLVIGAEIHSKGLDISDRGRDVTVLFGDGAGAVVVEATEAGTSKDPQIFSTHLHADGTGAKDLWVPSPGMAFTDGLITHAHLERGDQYPQMNGRSVFVNAVKRMSEGIGETLTANDVTIDDVDLFFFHQANLRINEAVAQRLGIPAEKVYNTIHKYGNTTAATIPLGMRDAVEDGTLQPGMLVAIAAFGGGFTWGSMLLRW
jgi:3-oxoacyl-[acyl-carrier-protein] synthase-3